MSASLVSDQALYYVCLPHNSSVVLNNRRITSNHNWAVKQARLTIAMSDYVRLGPFKRYSASADPDLRQMCQLLAKIGPTVLIILGDATSVGVFKQKQRSEFPTAG